MSQQMVNTLVKQQSSKKPLSSKDENKSDIQESGRKCGKENKPFSEDPDSDQETQLLINQITEEVSKEYQENFEKIKLKFKNTLKEKIGMIKQKSEQKSKMFENEEISISQIDDHHKTYTNNNDQKQIEQMKERDEKNLSSIQTADFADTNSYQQEQNLKDSENNQENKSSETNLGKNQINQNEMMREKSKIKESNKDILIKENKNNQSTKKETLELFEMFKDFLENKMEKNIPQHRHKLLSNSHIVINDQSYKVIYFFS